MSRLLLAFAVGISLLATTALAQEQQEQSKRFITTQACDPVLKMSDIVMNKYGETPLFQGEGLQFAAQTGQPFRKQKDKEEEKKVQSNKNTKSKATKTKKKNTKKK